MVQLKLFRKPKHRAEHSHAKALYTDLYGTLRALAHDKRVISPIRRLAVFSVRVLAPRPALRFYTKRVKNLELQKKATK
jgi:hypothetical protein